MILLPSHSLAIRCCLIATSVGGVESGFTPTKAPRQMVNLNNPTKNTWDALKPDNLSHDEFANLLLSTYLAHQNGIDHEKLIEQIKQEVISQAELAAYRGATEAVEDVVGDG